MKDIDKIVSGIKYNSIEVFEQINRMEELHTQINGLEFDINQLQNERQNILKNLCLNIDTFKAILEKLKTCYIAYISYYQDNLNQIKILNFKPAESNDFNVEEYTSQHLKKYDFKSFQDYELSDYLSNIKISNEMIIQKHIYIASRPSYTLDLKHLLVILSSNSGYFINKMEFNKQYELRNK